MALMERMTIRGRDRAFDRSRDRRASKDHQTASAKNDQPAVDPGAEDRKRMEGEQRVLK